MPSIQKLDPHLADLIAAGEVVERPASVVKELMENAIDAGARALTVEILRGGMSLIRLRDDGHGIPPEEVETAFLRHATSKIRSAEDLSAIETLGFRGEALAAIAAVSRIELLTRTPQAAFGCSLLLEGGQMREREEIGCPEGTTILVRDLFFNTPARLKFVKRDASEGAAVAALVGRMALAHPEVSIKFLREGKQELFTPGDGKLSSALHSVFGRDLALGFTEVAAKSGQIAIAGFCSLPVCCRGSRAFQHFILNGRPIRSPLLMAALEEAYRHQKMVGKFPACVLSLQVRPASVDVNVHPAKLEVKFQNEREIFDAVHFAVRSALEESAASPLLAQSAPPAPRPVPADAKSPSTTTAAPARPAASTARNGGLGRLQDSASAQLSPSLSPPLPLFLSPVPLQEDEVEDAPRAERAQSPQERRQITPPATRTATAPHPTGASAAMEQPKPLAAPTAIPADPVPEPAQLKLASMPQAEPPTAPAPWRLVGELLNTYLLVEQGETAYLIDKHAAHERLHFDRMRAEDFDPLSQRLLSPLPLPLPPEELEALQAQPALLERFGFLLSSEEDAPPALLALPDYLNPAAAEETLGELARQLLQGSHTKPQDLRDELLHSLACKAAIKGGQHSTREELLVLAQAVMEGAVRYCPHGRPVCVALPRSELERRFGRA